MFTLHIWQMQTNGIWSCISIEPPDKGPVLFRLGSFSRWLFLEFSSLIEYKKNLYEKGFTDGFASALDLEIDASSHIYIPSKVSCWSNFILLWFSHLGDIMKLFDHQELFSIEFQYYILYFCKYCFFLIKTYCTLDIVLFLLVWTGLSKANLDQRHPEARLSQGLVQGKHPGSFIITRHSQPVIRPSNLIF